MQDEQEAVGRLIQYLQAMQGQVLWSFEDSNLNRPHLSSAAALKHFVQSLVGFHSSTRQQSGTSVNSHALIPCKEVQTSGSQAVHSCVGALQG